MKLYLAIIAMLLALPVMGDRVSADTRLPESQAQIKLSFAPVVKRTAPAVVNVYSRRVVRQRRASPLFDDPFFRRFFGGDLLGAPRKRVQRSLGSGVIVDPSGIVVTNHHVIKGGSEVKVAFADGREFDADIVIMDKKSDLAVLRLRAKGETFPFLQFGNSDNLEVGDLVLAIGNPFGVGQTVTSGIVSALARTRAGISDYQFFIQTDAAINPGNSGGALIGVDGQLVGINTAIYSRSGGSNGIGFAIPVNMVRAVVDSAKSGKKIRRPWIGAGLETVTPDIAESLGLKKPVGVIVGSIYPGGPADKAGLRRSDIVLSVDGHMIRSPQGFKFRTATRRLGTAVPLEVFRGGHRQTMNLKLSAAPEIPPRSERLLEGDSPFAGATIANLSPAVAEELSLKNMESGVVVLDVVRRSPAQRINMHRGDIITVINGREIRSVSDVMNALSDDPFSWRMTIRRGKNERSIVIGG